MPAVPKHVVPVVVQQHAEESAILRNIRSVLVAAPHLKLHHLRRLDDRIAAHLDGLAVAGEYGSGLCDAALENPGAGEVFAVAVRALESRDARRLDRLFALAAAVPEAWRGLISAFGWVSGSSLQGTIKELLASKDALRRGVGIAACTMHRVDPAGALDAAMADPDARLRARALRAAGEVGRLALQGACLRAMGDEDAACRFWAAWSALLLGERRESIRTLVRIADQPGPFRERALRAAMSGAELRDSQAYLKRLSQDPAGVRDLIQAVGVVGDPHFVPWLIRQMEDLKATRLAGEAFSLITGLDLSFLDLDKRPPEGIETGPTENPEDEDVAMDPDDSLPWPDVAKIQAWWAANGARFQAGTRRFMGEPIGRENCLRALREGFQRQRAAAALHLCLLNPGTPFFPVRAPAWRQQRWLARMG
jgi:uncharacterized protein (TIGR02270 family)